MCGGLGFRLVQAKWSRRGLRGWLHCCSRPSAPTSLAGPCLPAPLWPCWPSPARRTHALFCAGLPVAQTEQAKQFDPEYGKEGGDDEWGDALGYMDALAGGLNLQVPTPPLLRVAAAGAGGSSARWLPRLHNASGGEQQGKRQEHCMCRCSHCCWAPPQRARWHWEHTLQLSAKGPWL